jgi:hypothetical protein
MRSRTSRALGEGIAGSEPDVVRSRGEEGAVLDVRWLFRGYQRELVCGRCEGVMAWVELRPFRYPTVRHVTGHEVAPMGEGLALRVARTRLDNARRATHDPLFNADPELPEFIEHTTRQIDYLRRQGGEPVYELLCTQCGADYLRSMPDLAGQVRRAPTGRVALR